MIDVLLLFTRDRDKFRKRHKLILVLRAECKLRKLEMMVVVKFVGKLSLYERKHFALLLLSCSSKILHKLTRSSCNPPWILFVSPFGREFILAAATIKKGRLSYFAHPPNQPDTVPFSLPTSRTYQYLSSIANWFKQVNLLRNSHYVFSIFCRQEETNLHSAFFH